MNLAAFLCMGRCKSLGSLKSFLCYAPQLSGASILCFLILSPLRVHRCGWVQQLTARWQAFFVSSLSSLRGHHQAAVMCWLDGCNILCWLIWQAIFLIHSPHSLEQIVFCVTPRLGWREQWPCQTHSFPAVFTQSLIKGFWKFMVTGACDDALGVQVWNRIWAPRGLGGVNL